jgi:hypothetical protein
MLEGLARISAKCGEVMVMALRSIRSDAARTLIGRVAVDATAEYARAQAMSALVEEWPDDTTRELLCRRAVEDESYALRVRALNTLVRSGRWCDGELREFLQTRVTQDVLLYVRGVALQLLLSRVQFSDDSLRRFLETLALEDSTDCGLRALRGLAERNAWADAQMRRFLERMAVRDREPKKRIVAIQRLGERAAWNDYSMCQFVQWRCREDPERAVRHTALRVLAQESTWSDRETRELLLRHLTDRSGPHVWHARELMTGFITRGEWWNDVFQLITRAATGSVRGRAAYEWFRLRARTDQFWRIKCRIVSKRSGGTRSHRDPWQPVTEAQLRSLAQTSGLSDDQVTLVVEQINAELGWDIRVGYANQTHRPMTKAARATDSVA